MKQWASEAAIAKESELQPLLDELEGAFPIRAKIARSVLHCHAHPASAQLEGAAAPTGNLGGMGTMTIREIVESLCDRRWTFERSLLLDTYLLPRTREQAIAPIS
ncbi:hypothetical protein [Synechococcus sp. PCC 7336]|uniref:hypothetical protein n=1 Tax=Synechococcus sp. PCC 7336 TaxID=195250 RepID=UPI0003486A7C|nr:hypothetical protein [Synechococcus sp. PCC 7336]